MNADAIAVFVDLPASICLISRNIRYATTWSTADEMRISYSTNQRTIMGEPEASRYCTVPNETRYVPEALLEL